MKFFDRKKQEKFLEIVAISLSMIMVFTFSFGVAQILKGVTGIESSVSETKSNSPIDYIMGVTGEDIGESQDETTTQRDNPSPSGGSVDVPVSGDVGGSNGGEIIDPTNYSKDQLIEYFNTAANRVRLEKPGFTYAERSKVSNTYFAGIKNQLIDSIVNGFFKDIDKTVKKGQASAPTGDPITISYFGSEQATWASKLTSADVTGYSCYKNGNNYIVTLKLVSEMNPQMNGKSSHSRGMLILTKQNVKDLAEPRGLKIQSLDDLNLSFHDGYITATIDQQGRIREMRTGFVVDGVGNNVSFNLINASGTVKMTISKTYTQTNFVW